MYNIYELLQYYHDGKELFNTGIKAIVRAKDANRARQVAAEDDPDRAQFWISSETTVDQIGWATGEFGEELLSVVR